MEANWCWNELGDYLKNKVSTSAVVSITLSVVLFCAAICVAYKCNIRKDPNNASEVDKVESDYQTLDKNSDKKESSDDIEKKSV